MALEQNDIKSTTLFGKSTNLIGSSSSELLLRSNGKIKLQWGNKFIDLIKDGKLNIEALKFIFSVDSEEDIDKDGIYLVNDLVWISIDGNKINILSSSDSNSVSFSIEQNKTSEEKSQAIKNIGIIYDNMTQALEEGIKNGIVYILDENIAYCVNNGMFTKLISTSPSIVNNGIKSENGVITLFTGDITIATFDRNQAKFNQNVAIDNKSILQSSGANETKGYRLYIQNDQSVLEVDNIIERNKKIAEQETYEIFTDFAELLGITANVILQCSLISEEDKTYKLSLKYNVGNQFQDGEKLYSYYSPVQEAGLQSLSFPVKTEFTLLNKTDNKITVLLSEDSNLENYTSIVGKPIYAKKPSVMKGTIIMFYPGADGTWQIPEGWAICNGENGTPNLVDRFIKVVNSAENVGEINNTDLLNQPGNYIQIQLRNLPDHNHPHAHDLVSAEEVEGEQKTATSDLQYTTVNVLTTNEGTQVVSSLTFNETNIKQSNASNDSLANQPINIEPRAYALIFIMKI